MIKRLRFHNFKALKNAEVNLGIFNVVVGPNGSGKSSLLQGLEFLSHPNWLQFPQILNVGAAKREVFVDALCNPEGHPDSCRVVLAENQQHDLIPIHGTKVFTETIQNWRELTEIRFSSIRVFSLEPSKMGQPVDAREVKELTRNGGNLVGALTHLRDKDEDAYDHLRAELQRWLPEFDSIGFENDENGYRRLNLRQKATKKPIPASQLSEGTLLALALLTIIYQQNKPTVIGLEEPDRGLHPRLLRDVRDALYRLSFPEQFGLKRQPVQVVVTTHSPYFLDMFKDHPEQIIIAEKLTDGSASFKSLADDQELREMIGDAPLGEVWYSGVLGGVPVTK